MEEEQKKKRGPKKLLIAASCVGLLAAAYLGVGIFFRSHFGQRDRFFRQDGAADGRSSCRQREGLSHGH